MNISVIICTYNRAESLRRTLETCCDLVIPAGVQWELLVVDNNSKDHTKQVCESLAGKLPLRYLFENRQGKSYALNTAVANTQGKLLLFTDDDVDIDPGWLAAFWNLSCRKSGCSLLGGHTRPRWEGTPPRWVQMHSPTLLRRVMMDGSRSQPLTEQAWSSFAGCNMALRKSVFATGITYRTDLGPTAETPVRSEEADLNARLMNMGFKGYFTPQAIVYHRTNASRTTEAYVRNWFLGQGIAEVRLGEVPMVHLWFGAPRYYWRLWTLNSLLYGISRWTLSSHVWLPAEIRMAHAWGVITECRRRTSSGSR